MKKSIVAGFVLSVISGSSFAALTDPAEGDVDTTSAEIQWIADIPTVVPGQWVTMTGADGGAIKDGVLTVNNDGSFTSDEIQLEVRNYDPLTSQVNGGVAVNPSDATTGEVIPTKITYQAEQVTFASEKGVDTNSAEAALTETTSINSEISAGAEYPVSSEEGWKTSWKISNRTGGELPTVIAGDKITATTVVRADVEYATAP